MEIFKNKFLVKLIASICLIFMLFSFTVGNKVYAAPDDEVWGGVLLNPIIDLLTSIGDTIMEILHQSVQSQEAAIIQIDGSQDCWEALASVIAVALAILAAAVFIAVVVGASGGIAAGAAALAGEVAKSAFVHAAVNAAGGALLGGAVAGIIAGVAAKEAMIPNDIYLPAFSITAEQIFRNELALFDVNFFNPGTYYTEEIVKKPDNITGENSSENVASDIVSILKELFDDKDNLKFTDARNYAKGISGEKIISIADARKEGFGEIIDLANEKLTSDNIEDTMNFKIYEPDLNSEGPITTDWQIIGGETSYKNTWTDNDKYVFGIIKEGEDSEYLYITLNYTATSSTQMPSGDSYFSAEEDLSYEFATGTPEEDGVWSDYETQQVELTSTAAQLQEIVSTWYFILRNIALLVLMLLLIYSGIRIVIGSTAGEKAKYKERLMDWLVAICLIFIMHYLMVFAVEIVEKITDLVGKTVNGNMAYLELTDIQRESAEEVLEGYDTTSAEDGVPNVFDDKYSGSAAGGALVWPTDLAGLYRIQSQMTETGTTLWAGYSLCYVVLVLFTLFFAFTYARRVLYMAFLTMIAPLVAMTYPIDKITDGKAQAFDAWLKEYIFNLMIQPLHLLLYNILVTSAFALATESPIYALVAIGFMMPAEKLMRKFFGFEKAKTPGLLGGAAGAAIAMTGLQSLMKHHPKGKNGSGGSNDKEKDDIANRNLTRSGGPSTTSVLAGVEGGDAQDGDPGTETPRVDFPRVGGPRADGPRADGEGAANPGVNIPRADGPEINANRARTVMAGITGIRAARAARGENAENGNGKRNIIRTLSAARKEYGRQLGKRVLKRVQNGQPVKAMVRGTAGLAGGALFGLSGLALGIASGDPSKAFQYTSAGALGGYSVGSGLAGSAANELEVDSAKDMEQEIERTWYGDEYRSVKYDEAVEKELKSNKNINYLKDTYNWSTEEAEEFLDTVGKECYGSGIRDVEKMAAIAETLGITDAGTGRAPTLNEAIAATKLKKGLPTKVKDMTDDKLKKYTDTWQNAFAKEIGRARGLAEDDPEVVRQAEERTAYTVRLMKSLDKAESSLSEV